MNFETNIETILHDAINKALHPDNLGPIIQKQVDSVVKSAIEDATGYRSEFKETADEQIRAAMPSSLGDISRFSDLVMKVLAAQVKDIQDQRMKEILLPRMEKILAPAPSVIKISELARKMRDEWNEDARDKNERPTFIIDKGDYGTTRFYADPQEARSKYSCSFALALKHDGDEKGEIWDVKINNEKLSEKMIIGCKFGIDAILLNIYSGATKLEIDTSEFSDLEYEPEYED